MKDREPQPSWLETVAARLGRHRTLLAATAASLVAVDLFLGGRGVTAMLGTAFVLAVAVLFPGRERQGKPHAAARAGAGPVGVLSAVDLAAAVQDPLYIFDRTGAVLHANEAAALAFGPIARGGALKLKFRAPEIHDFISRVLEGKEAPPAIDYIERVPIERAYRVTAMPIGGELGLYVLLFRDQSEARRIDRMRTDFIANASHELRTPLASIAGFIETLRGPARNDAKARDNFLQIMQEQTARMARLIDDLLSLSRLEAKPYVRPTERVDLRRLLQEVRDSLSHLATEFGVAIDLDLPEVPVEVTGNRDELVQVFDNLVENACKYGGAGGRVTVQVRRERPGAETAVTVTDFGPGIPQEHIPRITERFYRVDVETSRAQKGTGLGLAIVKHILTRHGARLSIRSKMNEGSSFTVHFPPG